MNIPLTPISRCLLGGACFLLGVHGLFAQPADPTHADTSPPSTTTKPAPAGASNMVTLNVPENMDLRVLVDYVGKRLNINFVYDESVGARRVTLKVPVAIPSDTLMTLLESVLKMHGLVAVPTEVPGMMRVENVKQLTTIAVGPQTAESTDIRPTQAVTRVFELRYAPPSQLQQLMTPFLSSNLASLSILADRGLLIITDYAGNMARIEQIVAVIDRPRRDVAVRMYQVTQLEAASLAQRITQLLSGKARAQGAEGTGAAGTSTLSVLPDERTNQLTIVGLPWEVDEVMPLIQSLDVSLGLETKVYSLTTASPEQVDRLVKSLIGELASRRFYQSATDREANLLIATTTPEIHQQINTMLAVLDKPVAEAQSPIRFYKLENAKALDVLNTLQNIEGDGMREVSLDGLTTRSTTSADAQDRRSPAERLIIDGPTPESLNASDSRSSQGLDKVRGVGRAVQLKDARLIADEATNTLIMIAPPSTHAVYEKLIQRLDVRRPQVLVDVTIVVLDTSDDFQLGVEIKRKDSVDGGQFLNFTSFGLSNRTPTGTGSLTLQPGLGFTGALISADIAEIVIRALESDSRAKVLSRPSILVNDNATGSLVSENEEPYSTLIATGEASREGFGGFVKAGTNLTITPQISEGDFLKLEYEATLSSFSSEGTSTLPPARQTNTLKSVATIPDGYTIVVGGLTRENLSDSVNRVPILGRIPMVEYLFSSRTAQARKATLFVFIRPVILRDDKFKHLKLLSSQAAMQVQLAGDFPPSEPLLIR